MMEKLQGKRVVLKLTGERKAETCPWRMKDLRALHGGEIDFASSVHETKWVYVFALWARLR